MFYYYSMYCITLCTSCLLHKFKTYVLLLCLYIINKMLINHKSVISLEIDEYSFLYSILISYLFATVEVKNNYIMIVLI